MTEVAQEKVWVWRNENTRDVTLTCGVMFTIAPLYPLFIERLFSDVGKAGKPKPPMREVTYGRKGHEKTAWEPNYADPDYQAALKEWKDETKVDGMKLAFGMAVQQEPPPEFVDFWAQRFPEYEAADMKYLWITSLLPDETAVNELTELVLGQTVPTEAGIEQAAETFRGDNRRDEHLGLPVHAEIPPSNDHAGV